VLPYKFISNYSASAYYLLHATIWLLSSDWNEKELKNFSVSIFVACLLADHQAEGHGPPVVRGPQVENRCSRLLRTSPTNWVALVNLSCNAHRCFPSGHSCKPTWHARNHKQTDQNTKTEWRKHGGHVWPHASSRLNYTTCSYLHNKIWLLRMCYSCSYKYLLFHSQFLCQVHAQIVDEQWCVQPSSHASLLHQLLCRLSPAKNPL